MKKQLEMRTIQEPDNALAWKEFGNYYLDQERKCGKAREYYLKAISIDRNYEDAHYNVAVSYFKENNRHDALKYIEKTLELNSNYAAAYNLLGVIQQQLGKFDESKTALRKAIQLNENDESYYFHCGVTILKEWEKISYRTAWEAAKDKPEMMSNDIFQHQFDLHLLDEAETCFNKAIELEPTYREAYYNLGYVYYRINQLEKAEQNLLQCLELKPGDKDTINLLAELYFSVSKLELAKSYYQKLVDLGVYQARKKVEKVTLLLGNVGDSQKDQNDLKLKANRNSKDEITYENKIEDFNKLVKNIKGIPEDLKEEIKVGLASALTKNVNPFYYFIENFEDVFKRYVTTIVEYYDQHIQHTLDEIRKDPHSDGEERYKARHAIYKKILPLFVNFSDVKLIEAIAEVGKLADFNQGEFFEYLTITPDVRRIYNRLILAKTISKQYIGYIMGKLDISPVKNDMLQEILLLFNKYTSGKNEITLNDLRDLAIYIRVYGYSVKDEFSEDSYRNILQKILTQHIYKKRKLIEHFPVIDISEKREEELDEFETEEKNLTISAIQSVGNARVKSLEDQILHHMGIETEDSFDVSWSKVYRHLGSFWEIDNYVIECFITLVKLANEFGLYGFYKIIATSNRDVFARRYLHSETGLFSEPSVVHDVVYKLKDLYRNDTSENKDTTLYKQIYDTLEYRYRFLEEEIKLNVVFIFYCLSYLTLERSYFIELVTDSAKDLKINLSFLFSNREDELEYNQFIEQLMQNNPNLFTFNL